MGKITLNGFVPRDDPMFTGGPQLVSQASPRVPPTHLPQTTKARPTGSNAASPQARTPQRLAADLATRLVEKISLLDTTAEPRALAMRKANLLADANALAALLNARTGA